MYSKFIKFVPMIYAGHFFELFSFQNQTVEKCVVSPEISTHLNDLADPNLVSAPYLIFYTWKPRA